MRWCVPFPMFPADQLVPMARAAEASGFDSIAVPDSVFFPEHVSADYPYSADGARFWAPDTPFVDPFVAMAAMAAVTDRIELTTNVVKLPLRNPLLVAKQLASLAVLAGNRVSLGVGLSWIPEEFAWTHTDMRTRGKRCDEMIAILRLICGGGGPQFVEHHGEFYDFDRLMIAPAPTQPVRIVIGGLSEPALRRAARLGDGWISVQNTSEEIAGAIARLEALRSEYGRSAVPFSLNVLAVDAFDLDGYHRLAELGVTEIQAVPWYFMGADPNDLQVRLDSLAWFSETVITRF